MQRGVAPVDVVLACAAALAGAVAAPLAAAAGAVLDGRRSALAEVEAGAARRDLVVHRPAPPPQTVVDWIRRQSIPLLTTRPGHGFSDLAPLSDVVGGARVVALGEATHGTREFFHLKHRLVEYMVSELGFSVFAIEAPWPESEAVDEYVRTGEGGPTSTRRRSTSRRRRAPAPTRGRSRRSRGVSLPPVEPAVDREIMTRDP